FLIERAAPELHRASSNGGTGIDPRNPVERWRDRCSRSSSFAELFCTELRGSLRPLQIAARPGLGLPRSERLASPVPSSELVAPICQPVPRQALRRSANRSLPSRGFLRPERPETATSE